MKAKIRPLAILCGLVVCSAPIGASASEVPLADVEISPYELNFNPFNSDEQHILRVSCSSGEYFEERFAEGEAPSFEAVDMEGFTLADGGCSYELRAIPATEGIEALDVQTNVQFGTLNISEGLILQPAFFGADEQN